MADEKLTALTANLAPISTDILYIVDDPGGTPLSQKLDFGASFQALWGLTPAADRLPYYTGAAAGALATFTAFGRSLVDDADAAAGRTTLAAAGTGVANTFTAAQMVDGVADAIQLRVQGHSTQTSNLQTWENSAGTVIGSINNTGSWDASTGYRMAGSSALIFSSNDVRIGSGASWFTLTFYTDAAAKMRLDISGQLSIGHITPAARLDTMDTTSVVTNAVVNHVIHSQRSTGTAAAGFGLAVKYKLESSTTNDTDAGRHVILWQTATHASRVPDGIFYLTDSAAEREIWRGRATGTAAAIGFLGATPVARAAHIADPTGGAIVDGESRTAIAAINVVLENLGFVATS